MTTNRTRALCAGLIYFSTHITSVAAVVMYGNLYSDPFSRSDGQILTGVLLEFLLALGCLGTGVALLPLLKPHGASLAHAYSALRTLEAAVILAGGLALLALLQVRELPDSGLIATTLGEFHRASFQMGQGFVIMINTIIIGYLLWRSGLVPRVIGIMGIVGGILVTIGNLLQFFGVAEQGGTVAGLFAVVVFAFEIAFAGYLVFKGVQRVPAG